MSCSAAKAWSTPSPASGDRPLRRRPLRPRVDVDGTANLLRAARAAGTPRLVYISIVGVDQIPYRYYQANLRPSG